MLQAVLRPIKRTGIAPKRITTLPGDLTMQ